MLSRLEVSIIPYSALTITYQLLQIPTAGLEVTLVLVHALCELLRIHVAASRTPVVLTCLLILRSHGTVVCLLFSWLA
jgi:hypothetical protein